MDDPIRNYDIVLHVGMQRTGTTFLQWNVFHYMDVNYLWHIFHKSWLKDVINSKKEIDLESINKNILKNLQKDKINLFSEENIYTNMFSKEDDRFIILKRIKTIFPKAKIIFGIREKDKLLISWYKQYVANGGILNFSDFLDNHMNLEKINYESYIKKIQDFYGEKNVLIYTLDDIKKYPEKLIKKLCQFMDIPQIREFRKKPMNTGYSLEFLKLSLLLNKIFKTPLNPNGLIPWPDYFLPHKILFQSYFKKYLPQTKANIDNLNQL